MPDGMPGTLSDEMSAEMPDTDHPPVETLVAHQAPMLLLDAVVDRGGDYLVTTARVDEQNIFYEHPRGVPSWVGLEYIAQTVAAYAGAAGLESKGRIRKGMLLGTRRFTTGVAYFPLGMELRIRVQPEFESAELAKFAGQIHADGDLLASGSVTVYHERS